MQREELNEEEANALLEKTLILISQQNLAQKQKNIKTHSCFLPESPSIASKATPKNTFKALRPQSLQMFVLSPESNLEKSPAKKSISTCHILPMQREEPSFSCGSSSLSSPLKHLDRESPREDFQFLSIRKRAESESMLEAEVERGDRKLSQMDQEMEGKLYLEGEMKDIKRDLEIRSRGKICKSQEINSKSGQIVGYHFYCKSDSECPFDCFLEYTGNRTSKNQKMYKLIINCFQHLKDCLEEDEEINFIKITKHIDSLQMMISQIISQKGDIKPKDILIILAEKLGEESHRFIYSGLRSKSYHKAAKKYFDNLIYKVKTQLGLF